MRSFSSIHLVAIFALATALTCVRPVVAADESPPPKRSATSKPVDLHAEMEAMNRALRTISRGVADPKKNEASLAAVNDLQAHTVNCKGIVPKTAATRPADQRDKFVADYHKLMLDVLKKEIELEQQLLAGENDKAAQTVKDLRAMETGGHKIFQPPHEQ